MKYICLERGSFGFDATEAVIARDQDLEPRFEFCEEGNLEILLKAERGNGLGIVPIENSSSVGPVPEVIRYWLKAKDDCPLRIVGEIEIHVPQCLLTLPGVMQTEGLTVISHPQSLNQCDETLKELGIKVRMPAL